MELEGDVGWVNVGEGSGAAGREDGKLIWEEGKEETDMEEMVEGEGGREGNYQERAMNASNTIMILDSYSE